MNETSQAQSEPILRACAILAQVARGRAQVYRWLALGFYPPDRELANALNSGQLNREIEIATAWLGQDRAKFLDALTQLRAAATIDFAGLARAYERLFGKSAARVSMRESTYRWREASGVLDSERDNTRALRQQYEQFGVAAIQDQEDLLPLELEFVAFLCEREASDWERNTPPAARQLRRQERAFLEDHLGRWLSEFCWRVTESEGVSFYGALARLSDTWLGLEYGPGYAGSRQP
jgi:TorA maturation chaperone TorD